MAGALPVLLFAILHSAARIVVSPQRLKKERQERNAEG
jgi:hypothetical protein